MVKRIFALICVTVLMVSLAAVPALAQQSGLVNIEVTDVLNDNTVVVAVPIGVAANVCGIQANVLAQDNVQEPVDCTASTTQDLPIGIQRQNGLI